MRRAKGVQSEVHRRIRYLFAKGFGVAGGLVAAYGIAYYGFRPTRSDLPETLTVTQQTEIVVPASASANGTTVLPGKCNLRPGDKLSTANLPNALAHALGDSGTVLVSYKPQELPGTGFCPSNFEFKVDKASLLTFSTGKQLSLTQHVERAAGVLVVLALPFEHL